MKYNLYPKTRDIFQAYILYTLPNLFADKIMPAALKCKIFLIIQPVYSALHCCFRGINFGLKSKLQLSQTPASQLLILQDLFHFTNLQKATLLPELLYM